MVNFGKKHRDDFIFSLIFFFLTQYGYMPKKKEEENEKAKKN